MAKWYTMTDEEKKEWEEWKATCPQVIKDIAEKYPVDTLFQLKDTKDKGYIIAYSEGGTVTLAITGQFSRILFGRKVFGIDPNNLIECDLPGPNDEVGDISKEAGYTQDLQCR